MYNQYMNFAAKKHIFLSLFFIFSITAIFAGGKKDKLFKSIEDGSYKEIKSLLRESKDYANASNGPDKDTLIMAALKQDRDLDVITILLRYGADPLKKNKNKQNGLMYAAQYSSDPAVLEKVIKHNTFFDFSKRRHILKKDKDGKTTFDYAKLNENPDKMLGVLEKWIVVPSENPEIPEETETPEELSEEITETEDEEISNNAEENASLQPQPEQPVIIEPEAAVLIVTETPVVIPVVKPDVSAETEEASSSPEEESAAETEAPAVENLVTEIPSEQTDETAEDNKPVLPEITYKPEADTEVHQFQKTYLFDYATTESDNDIPPEDENYDPYHTFIENADRKDLNGRTKLMTAAKKSDLKLAENLIYSGADVNATDNDGWTPLMFAARFSEDSKVMKLLIKNGAKKNIKNNYGVSALKLAAGFNKNATITAELLSGTSPAENDVRGSFIYAVSNGAPAAVLNLFFKAGLPVNAAYDGKTPLMYAAESNKDTKTIGWLLSSGAKTTYRSASGLTAFDFAKQNKQLPHDKNYWALKNEGNN